MLCNKRLYLPRKLYEPFLSKLKLRLDELKFGDADEDYNFCSSVINKKVLIFVKNG